MKETEQMKKEEDRLSEFPKEIYICKIGGNIIKNSYNQLFKGMKYVTILIFWWLISQYVKITSTSIYK